MPTKITLTLRDNQKTTKNKVISIVKHESILTKYGDIGTAINNYKIMKQEEKEGKEKGYSVKDLTRAGIVKQTFLGKNEDELVEFSLKQCTDIVETLKKEDKGIKYDVKVEQI